MSRLQDAIADEKKQLDARLDAIENFLRNVPEGCLECRKSGKSTRYYHVTTDTESKKRKKTYITKPEERLARALASKSYYRKLGPVLKKEMEAVELLQGLIGNDRRERIYTELPLELQQLVKPLYPSREYLLEKWNEMEFQKTVEDESHIYETKTGEWVRSKSELLIANELFDRGIPYRYEMELKLKGASKPVHPDFTILNLRIGKIYYWEHLGMMGSDSYTANLPWRFNLFVKNDILPGDKLIITCEDSKKVLDTGVIARMINEYLI